MKTLLSRRNQKGFTLIEIIAVLVILGILAAVAIPKYIDMRDEALNRAVDGAISELNARERLALAKWKLNEQSGKYEDAITAGIGSGVISEYDTKLGDKWNGGAVILDGIAFPHANKTVTLKRTPQATENSPAVWSLTSIS
jgi:prepilin-type N-terminal cleavage/methylation domain-containing protein